MELSARPYLLLALPLTCAMLLLPAGAASAAGCADERLLPDASNTAQIRAATRCLINKERARFGRKRLAASASLNIPAQSFAQQMVKDAFFDHVGPAGVSVLLRVKRQSNYITKRTPRYGVGENIAWGAGVLATPLETVRSWMHSPGHRRNILDRRYRDIGIGVAMGAPEEVPGASAATYSTVFGHRCRC
jgi:uncharacterized protein YkwD